MIKTLSRNVAIRIQDFGKLIKGNYFYIDKTAFIKEWWESGDDRINISNLEWRY